MNSATTYGKSPEMLPVPGEQQMGEREVCTLFGIFCPLLIFSSLQSLEPTDRLLRAVFSNVFAAIRTSLTADSMRSKQSAHKILVRNNSHLHASASACKDVLSEKPNGSRKNDIFSK